MAKRQSVKSEAKSASHNISQLKAPKGKLGVMIPGMGAVATTFVAGVEAVRKGLAKPIGSLTQMGTIRLGKRTEGRSPRVKEFVPLAGLDDLVFTGWDIFEDDMYTAAAKAGVLERHLLDQVKPFLGSIKPRTAVFDHNYVKNLDGPNVKKGKNKMDLAEQVRADIREFKKTSGATRLITIWCGSTESFITPTAAHETVKSLEKAMTQNDENIAPSMVYAYASLMEGVPFANGAPNLTVDIPAMHELSRRNQAPICGKDFKTGQTLIKTILAPGFKARMIGLNGWFSTNILGNRDGEVLDDPGSFKTKEESKLSVLEHILQPELYPDVERDDEAGPERDPRAAAVSGVQLVQDARRIDSVRPHAPRVGERAQHERRRTPPEPEVGRAPPQLVVRDDDPFPHVAVLRQTANGARAAEPVLRLLRRLDLAQRVERRVAGDVLREKPVGEGHAAAQRLVVSNGCRPARVAHRGAKRLVDALDQRVGPCAGLRADLPVARVPGDSGTREVGALPRWRDVAQIALDERRSAVERREVDRFVRDAGAEEHPHRRMPERVLEVEPEAVARAAVTIEVPCAAALDVRVVQRGVADAVVRRGELLLVPREPGNPPFATGTRRRIVEQRVVTPPFGGEEHGGLERPPVRRAVAVVRVEREDRSVPEPFVGIEVERRDAGYLDPARLLPGSNASCRKQAGGGEHQRAGEPVPSGHEGLLWIA